MLRSCVEDPPEEWEKLDGVLQLERGPACRRRKKSSELCVKSDPGTLTVALRSARMPLQLVLVGAGIAVLEQVFEQVFEYLFAQLMKLLGEKCNFTLSCSASPVPEMCPLEVLVDIDTTPRFSSAINARLFIIKREVV